MEKGIIYIIYIAVIQKMQCSKSRHKIELWREKEMFKLGIIEESLKDKSVLKNIEPYLYSEKVEDMPEEECQVVHTKEYHVDDETMKSLLDKLTEDLKPKWYIHAFSNTALYVVFTKKWFRVSMRRDYTWDEMIQYGMTEAKVDRNVLENISLDVYFVETLKELLRNQ